MDKTEFLNKVDKAIKKGWGIKVYVTMPNLPKPEIICNPHENIENKKDYYNEAYNDQMELETFNQIQIVDVKFINIK